MHIWQRPRQKTQGTARLTASPGSTAGLTCTIAIFLLCHFRSADEYLSDGFVGTACQPGSEVTGAFIYRERTISLEK